MPPPRGDAAQEHSTGFSSLSPSRAAGLAVQPPGAADLPRCFPVRGAAPARYPQQRGAGGRGTSRGRGSPTPREQGDGRARSGPCACRTLAVPPLACHHPSPGHPSARGAVGKGGAVNVPQLAGVAQAPSDGQTDCLEQPHHHPLPAARWQTQGSRLGLCDRGLPPTTMQRGTGRGTGAVLQLPSNW